jgi:hypothetical protein
MNRDIFCLGMFKGVVYQLANTPVNHNFNVGAVFFVSDIGFKLNVHRIIDKLRAKSFDGCL